MDRYAQFFVRRRGLVAIFVAAMTVLALFGATGLTFDDKPRGIYRADDGDFARLEELFEQFGSDDNDVFLVVEAEDWFQSDGIELLRSVAGKARSIEGVERVLSMDDVVVFDAGLAPRKLLPAVDSTREDRERARSEAHAHPLVRGRLLSDDGGTALVVVRLAGGSLSIAELEPITSALEGICTEASLEPGVRARLTGVPPFRVEVYDTIRREQLLFMGAGAILCSVLAWLFFRNVGAVVATTLPPVLGVSWTFGAIGLAGGTVDLLSTVLPTLVIVIGFTDSVHLMIDIRRSRASGASPLEAAGHAIRHLGVPCALTSLTTAVGFGSLAIGHLEIIRRFGASCAGGVILTFFAVITTLPLVASRLSSVGERKTTARLPERTRRLIDAVVAHPRAVALAGGALLFLLLAVCTRLVPENRLTEAIPRSNDTYRALKHCEQVFGGILPFYVLVEWEPALDFGSPEVLAAIRDAQGVIARQERLSRPVSAVDLMESLPGAGDARAALLSELPEDIVGRFLRPDLRRALVEASVPDLGTEEMRPLIEGVERGLEEARSRHPGIRFNLTGTDVVARRNINRMIVDLARGLAFAAVIIFGVIALEFRSLRIGLISLLPNLFPLSLVGALLVWTGRPLTMTAAVLFTVLLGLAVDDTIHFLARYRRERAGSGDPRDALRSSFLTVGAAILITTLVLGAGFAIVLFSTVPTNRLFAAMVCIGLAAALVGDLVLLPALLALSPRTASRKEHGPRSSGGRAGPGIGSAPPLSGSGARSP